MSPSTRRSFRPLLDVLDGRFLLSTIPLGPAQIRQAYGENFNFLVGGRTTTANGSGQTIAIISIGGLDNYVSHDLQTFDAAYGLPNPSLQVVYYRGAQAPTDSGGNLETSLDVEYAHAVAPGANILVVEAASGSGSDINTAVDWARRQPGVSVISMSFGGAESSGDHAFDSTFTTPAGHNGVTFVASSGDNGAWTDKARTQVGVSWPASDPNVLSVGGTTLSTTPSGGYLGESAWSGSGGGFSRIYGEPSYQRGVQNYGVRTVPDVAYDADLSSGVRIYDTLAGGWIIEGGTSAGAPQIAGLIAVANQGRALAGLGTLDGPSQTLPSVYRDAADFHDITTGSNGFAATRGYDVATGLGSPIAITLVGDLAFHGPASFASNLASFNLTSSIHSTSVTTSFFTFSQADSTPTTPTSTPTTPTAKPALALATSPIANRVAVRVNILHDAALTSLFDDLG